MGKPREDDQPQDQNLAREQLFSRASRGLLELGQALGIAEPAQVRGAETPREPGHGFRPGEAVPLESIVRSWLELRCLRPGAAPPTNQWQFLVDSERRSVDIRPRIRADCARPVLPLWRSRATDRTVSLTHGP